MKLFKVRLKTKEKKYKITYTIANDFESAYLKVRKVIDPEIDDFAFEQKKESVELIADSNPKIDIANFVK